MFFPSGGGSAFFVAIGEGSLFGRGLWVDRGDSLAKGGGGVKAGINCALVVGTTGAML